MSPTAVQQVLDDLRGLPESDQNLVLGFLHALKHKHRPSPAAISRCGRNPAIELIDGALVFTGEVGDAQGDWLRVVRDEREAEILRPASSSAGQR